ncbi:AmyA Glycosidases [Candidatus Nanopelagicaceae bacterium]
MKKSLVLGVALATSLSFGLPQLSAAENYAALFQPVARGDQSSESVYFVMTDRFADGDTSNDSDGFDPADIGYWHGGDFKGLTEKLSYIKSLGFSAIWITPPVKQQSIQGNSAAYHGYWGLDFMTVDPHLGSEADFKNLVSAAHAKGLKVFIDVVANHTADVISYKDGKAFIPAGKEAVKNPAFLNKIENYHNAGDSSFTGESALVGDFYGLDDLATEKPEVVKGFIDIWSYWIKAFDIDGMRIDTFKHVNPEFWKVVIPAIQQVAANNGKKSFPIFGEVADGDPQTLSSYVAGGQTPSVLDFGFNDQVTKYAASYGTSDKLAKLFNADDLYTTSKTSAYGLATFLGNHDMGRIGTIILRNATDNASATKRSIIAQSMLLLLRGGPVLYYGDEIGMTGAGGDKLARQDMFPTKVDSWKWEQRIGSEPIGEGSGFEVENPISAHISALQKIIAANPALRSGTQQTLFAEGQLFAVSRYADKQEYVVAFNTNDNEKAGQLKPITAGATWELLAGSCVLSASNEIKVPGNGFCVLKSRQLLGKSQTTKISAPKLSNSNDAPLWKQLSVTVNKPGYNSVTFLAREKGGKWKSLGTADRTTFASDVTTGDLYRVFLHSELFKKKTPLEFIAVLKTSDGKIISSAISKAVNN